MTFLLLEAVSGRGAKIQYSESVDGLPFTILSLLPPEFLSLSLVALFCFLL